MKQILYLAFGSNIGNSRQLILSTLETLHSKGVHTVKLSRFYLTKAYQMSEHNAPNFVNAVCRAESILSIEAILNICQQIENSLGRYKTASSVLSRTIDIDLLFYGNMTYRTNRLTIPHPAALTRDFVLLPLGEVLCQGWTDPINGLSYSEALNRLHSESSKSCQNIITILS